MNEKFNLWLKENGWNVKLNPTKYDWMGNQVLNKYSHLPEKFVNILEDYQYISSKDDTTWFICGEDYLDNSDDAFKWNEFELMSLEIAEGDEIWKKKIENWWSDKLPFIMSVKGEYSYYAIDFGNPRGAIIMGEEPEFEEACVVLFYILKWTLAIFDNVFMTEMSIRCKEHFLSILFCIYKLIIFHTSDFIYSNFFALMKYAQSFPYLYLLLPSTVITMFDTVIM